MTTNQELVRIFREIAAAQELLGFNPFRAVSNNRVAREIRDLGEDLGELVREDPDTAMTRLCELPGIGKGSAQKIVQHVVDGVVDEHRELMAKVPRGLFDVLRIPGVGPKAARVMWQELGIESVDDLKARLDDPALAALPRMGKKSVANIKKAIDFAEKSGRRIPIGLALPLALALRDGLATIPEVVRVDYAGSLRRGRETIGDLDFLVAAGDAEAVRAAFTEHPLVTEVLARGETKCSVRLTSGGVAIQADLRLVPAAVYGAALMYFTGSKEHNVRLRERAIKRGLRLNEYGLFEGTDERPQDRGETPLAAADEEAIYTALGLPFVPPELREDRGELDGVPSRLIEVDDVKAELHAHTVASDGRMTIEELAGEAKKRGYHTVAVTDHSPGQVIANGLSPERLREHMAAVRAVDRKLRGIRVLAGSEVDILPDGSLDYDDELLRELDYVVASPHAALRQSPAEATRRLLAAIAHPLVHVIGHPTGRMIGRREGLSPDMAALFAAAAEHDVALEVNANWNRLDLRDVHVRGALEHGCKIAIDTDAHRPEHFDLLLYGVLTARRGGLEPAACINAWPAKKLHAWLASKR